MASDLFHLGMMRREVGGHQLLDLMRLLGAETDQAQVVAQKLHRVVVGDEVREAAEQLASGRDARGAFQGEQAFLRASLKTVYSSVSSSRYAALGWGASLNRTFRFLSTPSWTDRGLAMRKRRALSRR